MELLVWCSLPRDSHLYEWCLGIVKELSGEPHTVTSQLRQVRLKIDVVISKSMQLEAKGWLSAESCVLRRVLIQPGFNTGHPPSPE